VREERAGANTFLCSSIRNELRVVVNGLHIVSIEFRKKGDIVVGTNEETSMSYRVYTNKSVVYIDITLGSIKKR